MPAKDAQMEWSNWSNDSNFSSSAIMLQEAAAEVFGTSPTKWQKEVFSNPKRRKALEDNINRGLFGVFDKNKVAALVKHIHSETQKQFAGLEEVTLFRGIKTTAVSYKEGDVIPYESNILSSWSTDFLTADAFLGKEGVEGGRKEGMVIAVKVPVSRLFGVESTGLGMASEGEVVVIGGGKYAEQDKARVVLVSAAARALEKTVAVAATKPAEKAELFKQVQKEVADRFPVSAAGAGFADKRVDKVVLQAFEELNKLVISGKEPKGVSDLLKGKERPVGRPGMIATLKAMEATGETLPSVLRNLLVTLDKGKKDYTTVKKIPTGPVVKPTPPTTLDYPQVVDVKTISATLSSYSGPLTNSLSANNKTATLFSVETNKRQQDNSKKYGSNDPNLLDSHEVFDTFRAWQSTSSETPGAMFIQARAAEVFQSPQNSWTKKRTDMYEKEFKKFGEEGRPSFNKNKIDSLLTQIYQETQKDLKDLGVSEIVLYRGIKTSSIEKSGETSFSSNSLSSWTSDPAIAKKFGGVILRAKVPVSRIFSTSRTGFGTSNEREFVLLGGTAFSDTVYAEVK